MRDENKQIELNNKLFSAARSGNLPEVQLALSMGADVNTHTDNLETPLHAAAYRGHLEIVKLLCERGANIRALYTVVEDRADDGEMFGVYDPPIVSAAQGERVDIVKYLYSQYAHLEDDIVFKLLTSCSLETLKFLISSGVDINLQDIGSGQAPIHFAAGSSEIDILQCLCDNGAYLHMRALDSGNTALHEAVNGYDWLIGASEDALRCVEILCKAGLKINAKNKMGITPLHLAVKNLNRLSKLDPKDKASDIVRYLCENGGDIRVETDEQESVLMIFVQVMFNRDAAGEVLLANKIAYQQFSDLFKFILTTQQHCFLTAENQINLDQISVILESIQDPVLESFVQYRKVLTQVYESLWNATLKMDVKKSLAWLVAGCPSMIFSDLKAIAKGKHKILKTQEMGEKLFSLIIESSEEFSQENICRLFVEFSDYFSVKTISILVDLIDLSALLREHDMVEIYNELAVQLFERANDWSRQMNERIAPISEQGKKIIDHYVIKFRCLSLGILLLNNQEFQDSEFLFMHLFDQLVGVGAQTSFVPEISDEKKREALECIMKNANCGAAKPLLEESLGLHKNKAEVSASGSSLRFMWGYSDGEPVEKKIKLDQEEVPEEANTFLAGSLGL